MIEKYKDSRTIWKIIFKNKVSYEIFKEVIEYCVQNIFNEQIIKEKYEYYIINDIKKPSDLFYNKTTWSLKYWETRGWKGDDLKNKMKDIQGSYNTIKSISIKNKISEIEAEKILEIRKTKRVNSYKNRLDYDETCKKRTKWRTEYWLNQINKETNKKYSLKEANIEISKLQSINSNKYVKKRKENPEIYMGVSSNQLEYWIEKGYSKKLSEEKRKERQTTFSLEICIEKYGKELGIEKFKQRQLKWQNTLNTKYTKEYLLEKRLKFFKRYSKSSIIFFKKLIERLKEEKYNFTYFYGDNERFIYDTTNKKIYFYDFYIKEINLYIEYHGIVYHPNNLISEEELKNWHTPHGVKGIDIKKKDEYKKYLVEKEKENNYMVVWENCIHEKEINKITNKIKEIWNKQKI